MFLGWGLNVGLLIYRVVLTTLDGVQENFGSLLDALEEAVILSTACGSLFVWVMTEDLLAMGTLDLIFGSFEAIFRETEDSIVVLTLR